MKLPDVNIFLYAADETSPRHHAALAWVNEALSGSETVALAWATMLGFIRISTNPAAFAGALDPNTALDLVERWLAQPSVTIVNPTERHAAVLREMLTPLGTAGNLTSDAHLAALAIEHGATLCSCDNDFSRFAGLRWVDPLRG
ncbi:MAG TPA: type II toxin-antitoxin system VapC family toxin [Solirubrobacteraceae bacterium]|nr:type II toxin-antitoxin system VapC family toxin [Solirubrobacteraceae bacterium]